MFGSYSGRAGGNIYPSRFVVRSAVAGESVITQAGSNVAVWGISPSSTRRMALAGWDDGYAAISGDDVNVFGDGDDQCYLELAGTVSSGGTIKSDADGKGVAASSDKDHVGAIALESGVAGDLIRVKPKRYDIAV